MGRPTGLEPATPGTTNRCSNQLSYDRHCPSSGARLPYGWGRKMARSATGRRNAMAHETLIKFGYPGTLLKEGRHWALLLRPAQPTLGSLVLCAASDARAYGDLPPQAFAEQAEFVVAAERLLRDFVAYERINYLMLMMVDPHVHFHIIPRYDGVRSFAGEDFPDAGWPGLPTLTDSRPAPSDLADELRQRLAQSEGHQGA